jgi:hypothetical protein
MNGIKSGGAAKAAEVSDAISSLALPTTTARFSSLPLQLHLSFFRYAGSTDSSLGLIRPQLPVAFAPTALPSVSCRTCSSPAQLRHKDLRLPSVDLLLASIRLAPSPSLHQATASLLHQSGQPPLQLESRLPDRSFLCILGSREHGSARLSLSVGKTSNASAPSPGTGRHPLKHE